MGMPVKLGIIPMGSANGLASELGIPAKADDALQLILTGTAKPMDVVRINDDHISLHLSDVGINARIIKEFEKEGKRGLSGYARHFFRELFKPQESFRCIIRTGNNIFSHRAYMVLMANASSYRSGAVMNPRGKIDDGKFEIIVMKPYRRWVWRSIIGAFTGTLDRQPNIETYECESAVIRIIPGQELQVDGEILGKYTEVKASIYRHALNVILA
jgi:diacylglycerol kinase family enzyme